MDLSEIGFFQFDNLVRNRIPFLILHEGIDFSEIYQGFEKEHLERWSLTANFLNSPEGLLAEIEKRKIPRQVPLILLDRSGLVSSSWVSLFEKNGFVNVYRVTGGWELILQGAKDAL